MKKQYINEMAWNKIFNFLKQQNNIYTKAENACKRFVEAIFWMARTGAQWRELPESYGKWNSIFSRFNDWSKKQIWNFLHAFCINDPDLEYVMIDATVVRAHACAAGYKEQNSEGLGPNSGGFTSKIHASVDALGNTLKFIITAGQQHDITQANILLEDIINAHVIEDKGYDSNDLRLTLTQQDCIFVIPSRSNSKDPHEYDEHIYKERYTIEWLFLKIKHFRRIFSRFDKSKRNFASFLSFVGTIIQLR